MTAEVIALAAGRSYRDSTRCPTCPRCMADLDAPAGVMRCPACELPVHVDTVRVPHYRARALLPVEIARLVEIEGHGGDPWSLPPADLAFVVSGRTPHAAMTRPPRNGWRSGWAFVACCIAVAIVTFAISLAMGVAG